MKVLFVCTGNTCRSPMAEALLKDKIKNSDLDITVDSCGINVYESESINPKACDALKTLGVDNIIHFSRQFIKKDIDESDLVLTMTQFQKTSLIKIFPDYKYKVFTILEYTRDSKDEVSDPYGKSQIFYNFCANEINVLCDELLEILKEQME